MALALDPQPQADQRERQAHAGREENEIFRGAARNVVGIDAAGSPAT
jgi:hypothetical protein